MDYNLRKRNKNKNKKVINDSDSDSDEEYLEKKRKKIVSDSDSESLGEENEEKLIDIVDLINGIFKGITEEDIEEEEKKDDKNINYLDSLPSDEKKKLKDIEDRINKINLTTIPLRYKILESDMEDNAKALLIQKVNFFEKLQPYQSEYSKLKKYMEGILNIPFNKYKGIPIASVMSSDLSVPQKIFEIKTFINNLKDKLNKGTYGQIDAKNTIMEIVGKWITNPKAKGNIIGLCGPAGVGKTSIIKNGLSNALELPFGFITLGGSICGSDLEGSNYTFEGSGWGRIVDILMENKCMNPILFFDELDKITEENKFGNEVISLLIHLTDSSQNSSFNDKYFSGIDFDLSKCFIIFSFNDKNKINPILRDRINIVELKGFEPKDKVIIAKDYMLDNICKNIGIDKNIININDETIKVIVNTYCPEQGVRKLEQCLNSLIMKINLFHITRDYTNLHTKEKFANFICPYNITSEIAIKLLDPIYRKDDMDHSVKMMYN
jgi:ATP-dependent Lon protease